MLSLLELPLPAVRQGGVFKLEHLGQVGRPTANLDVAMWNGTSSTGLTAVARQAKRRPARVTVVASSVVVGWGRVPPATPASSTSSGGQSYRLPTSAQTKVMRMMWMGVVGGGVGHWVSQRSDSSVVATAVVVV
jgi:hypothetical protein